MNRIERTVAWFPRGLRISEAEWDRRHRTLTVLLAVQVPLVFVFGLWRGYGAAHLTAELAIPVATVLLARASRLHRRVRATAVTAGLVFLSAALVHLSGGYIEAHFHFFIMLGFIALYQDWFPFGWAIGFVVISHGFMTLWDPDSMFNHEAAQQQPFVWAGIHGAAVAFACAGQLTAWKAAEREAEEKARAREQATAERRDAIARLYVDLSRRNGTLVENQLAVIDTLEREVEDPDVLGRLFELDHLTTRIRRNGESLLVVAGADPVVTRRRPMQLVDVARAAVSEVDQYARVEVRVDLDTEVHGPAVRDLAHLLAELIDNGTAFSPPGTNVLIDARPGGDGGVVVTVEDRGLGMDPEALAQANRRLRTLEELTAESTRHLGHHVVGRLSSKHGIDVTLRPTDGGGITAVVSLPPALVVRRDDTPTPPAVEDEPVVAAPTPEAAPAPGASDVAEEQAPPVPPVEATAPAAQPGGGTSPAPTPAPEPTRELPVRAHALSDLSFTSTGAGRGRRRPAASTPAADTATAPAPLPVRTTAAAAAPAPPVADPVPSPAARAATGFVAPPLADVAPVLPARDSSPGLPTRRPGAHQAAARATGLFGSPATETTGHDAGASERPAGDIYSAREALRALSEYQQAQRAVRGADSEES